MFGKDRTLAEQSFLRTGGFVTGKELEQWSVLCTQAAEEQDPRRFLELTQEIERLLEEKKQRLLGPQREPKVEVT
jgi:hypothetical protein